MTSEDAGTARLCHCQKLACQIPGTVNLAGTKVDESGIKPTREAGMKTPYKLSGELLYGGKGKNNSPVTPDCIDNISLGLEVKHDQGGAGKMEGICPPRLEITRDSVRRDMKRVLHKENMQRQHMLKTLQAAHSQWTMHSRTTSPTMPPESPEGLQYRYSMCP